MAIELAGCGRLRFGATVRTSMDELLLELLWCQLSSIGLFALAPVTTEQLRSELRALYWRWLDETLVLLQAHGYVAGDNGTWSIAAKRVPDAADAWNRWETLRASSAQDPDLRPRVDLLDATLRKLPAILAGSVSAAEVIYPASSSALVEAVYRDDPISRYFNERVADVVLACLDEHRRHDASGDFRIIELGSGSAAASLRILDRLADTGQRVDDYLYADVSGAFAAGDQLRFDSGGPFVRRLRLDLQCPLSPQGVETGRYDLLVVSNVLQATRNVRTSLRHAKSALRRNGLVVLNEISASSVFHHLTFALLATWWDHDDAQLRISGCPGLAPESWQSLLAGEGYGKFFFPSHPMSGLGQQLIVAESDGVIWQPRESGPDSAATERRPAGIDIPSRLTGPKAAAHQGEDAEELLRQRACAYFKALVAKALKMPLDQIDETEPFEGYGIDSILIVQLTRVLKAEFGNVSSTLFFENRTVASLTSHFLSTHRAQMVRLAGVGPVEGGPRSPGSEPAQELPSATRPPLAEGGAMPIAIIGLSGRYPMARNPNELWERLRAGQDCVTEIPQERWPIEGFYVENPTEANLRGKSYCKWGGFIDGASEFDPLLFNIAPNDAMAIDPQERLYLQCCWEVFEDAGYTRQTLRERHAGEVGIFAGITRTGFDLYGPPLWAQGGTEFPHTSFASVANRVSYTFDLHGPSMPIDTMCSASLTAVHEACEHIRSGECQMAVAGGVNIYLHPSSYVSLCMANMLARDGRCRAFGADGTGFVPGEAVGAILLKPLDRAEADGDHIYGVILGSAVNHGGKTHGYTVPNPKAQAALIGKAIARAQIAPGLISYVEAHGTGTALGDPIEISALGKAFGRWRDADAPAQQGLADGPSGAGGFCAIGSIKTNIGHCESAAGIVGLTKVLLQMKHRELVPSLHAEQLNPNIDFSDTPFRVQRQLAPWLRRTVEVDGRSEELPRIASVSSFGAGGTNAHVIVSEYLPKVSAARHASGDRTVATAAAAIVLSAQSHEQLRAQAANLLEAIRTSRVRAHELADAAYTLQVGREAMPHRLAFCVVGIEAVVQALEAFLAGRDGPVPLHRGHGRRDKHAIAQFETDERGRHAVASWLDEGNHEKLLALWVKGLTLDWQRLYKQALPKKISLPTYPFASERYVLPKPEPASAAPQPPVQATAQPRSEVHYGVALAPDVLTFVEHWRSAGPASAPRSALGTVVCCLSRPELQEAFSRQFLSLSPQTRLVYLTRGSGFARNGEVGYEVVADDPSTFTKAARAIAAAHGPMSALIYGWPLEEEAAVRSPQWIAALLKGLSDAEQSATPIVAIGEYESVLSRCHLESWIGFERSLQFALPEARFAVLLAPAFGARPVAGRPAGADALLLCGRWAHRVWCELQPETLCSVHFDKDGGRQVCETVPHRLATLAAGRLRNKGTYFITGGFGGIGQILCRHLAARYQARLVVTGRADEARHLEVIEELRGLGAEAIYVQADVCDPDAMAQGLWRAEKAFGPVHGVFHVAGVQGHQTLKDISPGQFEAVLSAKVEGARQIWSLFDGRPLDFI
jgi:polyketide synthase PksM